MPSLNINTKERSKLPRDIEAAEKEFNIDKVSENRETEENKAA